MSVIEIQTIEGGRLLWVAVMSSSDREFAIEWGDAMADAKYPMGLSPVLRLVEAGKVVGAWNVKRYINGEAVYDVTK